MKIWHKGGSVFTARRLSAVLARGIPSVSPSVTFQYCVQINEDTIMRFTASGRKIPLLFGEVKFTRIFAGELGNGANRR